MARQSILVGIDGGGSGCRIAIVGPGGDRLALAHAGPANVTTDRAGAIVAVLDAIDAASRQAGLDDDALRDAVAHVGLAGVLTEQDAHAVSGALPFGRCVVTDDRPTFVAGALGSRNGALVAAGTGSFVAAQRDGKIRCVGGWGMILGDQASGAWLGQSLFEHVLLAVDGLAESSPLTDEVLDAQKCEPTGLVLGAATARPADFADWAPRIVAAAERGDAVGRALMQRGADYLDRALSALGVGGARLGAEGAEELLCLSGGVGPHYAPYLTLEGVRIVAPSGTALDGALHLAERLAQDTFTESP
ncbi:BadF/BadG/BcrA/BcrD ATPase family protein [Cognatishimia sp. F0-27]|uniref:BadF/BadG/BcrA/BcrD ATPase family protein n=1 Tax=Cognatishimia sp. F0-27 TaxID=2816855 RepID=UPI001D0C326E|nr:BadF/BadG/BcrA/BcrD ATPase family protein [Cognatishimia sp. F0-27]MCC1493754.1 N-acetylglucosamine kinase [Cognatishimia sp. F0-27]